MKNAGMARMVARSPECSYTWRVQRLSGKVAVVTGASRGVGRGVAHELATQGASVFVTGRSELDLQQLGEGTIPITCDHTVDAQVDAAFQRIARDDDRIDILVNNVWGGYERMVDNGEFTWSKPFWEQPLWRWDAMLGAGTRAHYRACQLAAPAMISRRTGLIVNISFWAAQKHVGNVAYGVSKAATDKMTADMAVELQPHGVTVVSLYPGLVRTEKVMDAAAWLDLSNSESPEFIGRAVAALAADANVIRHTGKVLVAAALAHEYGFTDLDGRTPRPLTLGDV
jgi:dehydrogenase/reductase SDR family member 1